MSEPVRHPFEQPPPPTEAPPPPEPPPPRVRLRIPGVEQPWLTYGLLVVNLLVFGLTELVGQDVVFGWGAKSNPEIWAGQYWRLVTPIFLHAGVLHLAFNNYALYVIGPQIERPFGHVRFLGIYMLAGVAGTLASLIFSQAQSVGASGAIFGLIGAMIVFLYQNRTLFGPAGQTGLRSVIWLTVINLLISFAPGIDLWGHAGGLMGGLLLTLGIGPRYAVELDYDNTPRVVDLNPLSRGWPVMVLGGLALVGLAGLEIALHR
jgi:rhomboid protease GluP